MARPTDRDEAKTAVLNIRVTPRLKEKLEAHAKIAGRKLSAEAERRLLESVNATERPTTPETRELLAEIEALIGEIEEWTGAHWHSGAKTWAAVAEMLASGPIMSRAPASISAEDAPLQKLYEELLAAFGEQADIERVLALVNINHATLLVQGREAAIAGLERRGLPEDIQADLIEQVDQLAEVGNKILRLWEQINELLEPFREAMESGRALYPKPRTGIALKAIFARQRTEDNALMRYYTPPQRWRGSQPATLGGLHMPSEGNDHPA